MIEVSQAGTPGWWLARLLKQLGDQNRRYQTLDDYYTGCADVPITALKSVRQAYQRLMYMARTNFAELVVEAVRERMTVSAFRTGADGDDQGDQEAWRIWQANSLDADSSIVHRMQLAMSDGYVMVGPPDRDIDAPVITPEDPREIAVQTNPVRRRKIDVALKAFTDDVAGVDRAFLFAPGQVWRAVRKRQGELAFTYDLSGWEWESHDQLPATLADVVPIVRFPNRPDRAGHSTGEFEPHLPILDRINYTILSRLEIATLQAFRQRAVKGVPMKDAAGNDIDYSDVFAADPGAMWHLPDTAEIWESGAVDLGPIRDAIRHDVQDLAAVTRTPLFYLTPDANNGSAEGASLAREGLVFKTTDRIVQTGESWEQVMSLAFRFAGDQQRAKTPDLEIVWASPERFSLAERYDAASKAVVVGVPFRSIMQDILQFSPQQVDRMEAEKAADALLNPPPQLGVPNGATPTTGAPQPDQTVPATPANAGR